MEYTLLKNTLLSKVKIALCRHRYLAMFLVLLPILFISFGTTFSSVKSDTSVYIINYYSQNAVAIEATQSNQLRLLEAAKNNRVVFSAFSLIPHPKYALNLTICHDISDSLILNNIPHHSCKRIYLLSDLPPPSYLI
jgi:hypothetical protein